jgi:hypothetical protein
MQAAPIEAFGLENAWTDRHRLGIKDGMNEGR